MSRKFKGFSLAELLISLLVISIVLSAAIPTLTRRSASTSEQVWRWTANENNIDSNRPATNSAYFGVGALQTAILGNSSVPSLGNTFIGLAGIESLDNIRYTSSGDKLAILKSSDLNNPNTHLMNSHISFYNITNNPASTTADIEYAGRIALEKHNMAFGIGSLQSLNDTTADFLGNNTAIGHFTLTRNQSGAGNTAVGELALANNTAGHYNTGIGYLAANYIGTTSASANASSNTAVGAEAFHWPKNGHSNTAVGVQALRGTVYDSDNTTIISGSTAIGAYSLLNAVGTGNTALGTNSCNKLTTGKYNVCIGYGAGMIMDTASNDFNATGQDDNNLYIGFYDENNYATTDTKAPLIFGRMQYDSTNSLPRQLIFSTEAFDIRTFDGANAILEVDALQGGGHDTSSTTINGNFKFIPYKESGQEVALTLSGDTNNILLTTTDNKTLNFNNGALKLSSSTASSGSAIDNANLISDANYFNIIADNGTSDNSAPTIMLAKNDGVALSANGSKFLIDGSGNMTFDAETTNMNFKSTSITFNSDIYVGDGKDITIPSITGMAGSGVAANINQLWQMVNNGGGGGIPSDERLKNISGDSTAGLKEINALEVKNYTYKNDKEKTPHVGVIAQQLQKVFPNSVFKDNKGFLNIKTEEIFFAMVNSIKELYTQIQDLTAKIIGLDKRIETLEKENEALKKQNEEFEKRIDKLEQLIL